MAKLTFTHPKLASEPLGVQVNPNQIEWSYGLNVANYPTYGGEVIQILSAYIDDMTISGNVETYAQAERIYSWFITYIQVATVGTGSGRFNVQPVQMSYPERGWTFNIYPTSVPGFKYGRDVVAPEWTLTAAVVDPAQDLLDKIVGKAAEEEDLRLFGKATGNIGYEAHDPFSDPEGGEGERGKKNAERFLNGAKVKGGFKALADDYNKLLPAYLEGDFSDLTADYSRPVVKGIEEEAKEAVKKKAEKGQKAGKNG